MWNTFCRLPLTFAYSGVRMVMYGFVHLLLENFNIKPAMIVLFPFSRHGTSRAPGRDILLSTSPL